jgi:riboflavin kinase/FMN adenylyltransferase
VKGLALSIGVFDGVHLGHQRLLSQLAVQAAASGLTPAVATFDPHPLRVLAPDKAPRMLTSIDHRLEILQEVGMGAVGVMPFAEIREMDAGRFAATVLADRLQARHVVVGENFQFGRGGKGTPDTLRRAGEVHGFEVQVISLFRNEASEEGKPAAVTSSRVRRCVAEGRTGAAARLLGRPFELREQVVEGDRRGRQLGIPTANLIIGPHMAIPANGIYAAWAEVNGQTHRAALNIGVRPTFGEGKLIIEAHLLDFGGDLYGKELRLRFVGDRIRPELAYSSVEALMDQVEIDIREVREMLDAEG